MIYLRRYCALVIGLIFINVPVELTAQKEASPKVKALIIDGENNHGVWPKTTMMMKDYLEKTGIFEVEIARTAFTWQGSAYDASIGLDDIEELLTLYPLVSKKKTVAVDGPVPDPDFSPNFDNYDVVISNLGWKASTWPKKTRKNFEKYMSKGGGLVIIHAANNSWGDWPEFNKMIGLGGWDGRDTESGPYVYYDNDGQLQYDPSDGVCGSHGAQHEFIMVTRAPEHPVMQGLPTSWLHTKDELYDRLRGPAKNMTVLSTAFSGTQKNASADEDDYQGSERHEPLIFTVEYGKGRVFHSALGHMDYSMECAGFITTFQRGAEWAATGKVTQKVPTDFPGTKTVSIRNWD